MNKTYKFYKKTLTRKSFFNIKSGSSPQHITPHNQAIRSRFEVLE